MAAALRVHGHIPGDGPGRIFSLEQAEDRINPAQMLSLEELLGKLGRGG